MSLINESPDKRRTISVEIDEVHYQFLIDIAKESNDIHARNNVDAQAAFLADRILNQQLAEEIKQEYYLKDKYRLETLGE